jgi:diadenosine tetraphosphate (Ap4A) HIT family hydrolase
MSCLTCKIIEGLINPPGGIIYRDDQVIVNHILDINIPGYVILSSLRHVTALEQLDLQELNRLFTIMQSTTQKLKHVLSVDKIYICSFCEETEHVHFHLFPRYVWMLNIKDAYTDEKVDAAKLFSSIRNKYQTNIDQVSSNEKIIEVVNYLRKIMGG